MVIKIKVKGSRYSVDFESLQLVPQEGFLVANVQINRASVTADSINLKKKVLGVTISSTCKDTTITIKGQENLKLRAEFSLAIAGDNIKVGVRKVDFTVREDQYHIKGPRKCSGSLGVGSLIKSIVRSALKARSQRN